MAPFSNFNNRQNRRTNRQTLQVRAAAPDIEWRKIVGLRNVLAHEYFGVTLPMIWGLVQNKVVPLEITCRILLAEAS
ncbi:MAG: hypothetical protein A2521_08070 [Deltaproteobacteria bacterium RIFOXYD12_FULL_57_12]|nr:MAG: hypothetical protein A2521_08070 [Deltaproteobacteria bacterium RIFOXYD12_FULL_57_12]